MIDYEKQNEEFSKWWDDQAIDSNRWTTLERIAAQNAWMEAHKRALNLYNAVGRSEQLLDFLKWKHPNTFEQIKDYHKKDIKEYIESK